MAAGDLTFQLVLEAQGNMSKELQSLQKELAALKKAMEESGKAASKGTSDAVSAYRKMKQDLVSLGLGAALLDFGKSSIKLAGDLQLATVAFTTMLGSAEKAQKMLDDLTKFATQTPFELVGIRDTAKQLLAFGIEANNIIPSLKMLGDVSAGLGVPIQQIALAFGQVKVAGRLMGQDLLQFINAGVPLIPELSKNLGVAQSKIREMVEKGQIGFSDVAKAFQTMTSEGGKFANMMSKAGGTYPQVVSNFNDEVDKLKTTFGTTLLPMLTEFVKRATKVIGQIGERAKANPNLAKTLAMVGVSLGVIVTTLAALGGPLTAAIAAIGALTAAFIFLKGELQKADSVWGNGMRSIANGVLNMVNTTMPALSTLIKMLLTVRSLLNQTSTGGGGVARGINAGRRQMSVAAQAGTDDLMNQKFDFTGLTDAVKGGTGGGKSVKDKLKEAIEQSNKDFVELISKRAEQLGSSAKKVADWIKSGFETQSAAVKQVVKDLVALETKYKEFGETAKRSLYETRAAMVDLNSSFTDKLGERFVDLQKTFESSTDLSGEKVQEIRKEMQLIRDTIGNDAISKAFDASKLSESQKIIQDRQSQQSALTEKQSLLEIQKNAKLGEDLKIRFEEQAGILKAYYTTKEGIEKEVKNKENLALAQEIIDKQTAYTKDYENIKSVLAQTYQAQVEYLASVQSEYDKFSQYMDNQTRRSTEAMIGQYQKLLSVISLVNAKTGGKYMGGISQEYVPITTVTPQGKSGEGVIINVGGISISSNQDPKVIQTVVQEAVVNAARRLQAGQL